MKLFRLLTGDMIFINNLLGMPHSHSANEFCALCYIDKRYPHRDPDPRTIEVILPDLGRGGGGGANLTSSQSFDETIF